MNQAEVVSSIISSRNLPGLQQFADTNGIDFEVPDGEGASLLYKCVRSGWEAGVEFLVARGALIHDYDFEEAIQMCVMPTEAVVEKNRFAPPPVDALDDRRMVVSTGRRMLNVLLDSEFWGLPPDSELLLSTMINNKFNDATPADEYTYVFIQASTDDERFVLQKLYNAGYRLSMNEALNVALFPRTGSMLKSRFSRADRLRSVLDIYGPRQFDGFKPYTVVTTWVLTQEYEPAVMPLVTMALESGVKVQSASELGRDTARDLVANLAILYDSYVHMVWASPAFHDGMLDQRMISEAAAAVAKMVLGLKLLIDDEVFAQFSQENMYRGAVGAYIKTYGVRANRTDDEILRDLQMVILAPLQRVRDRLQAVTVAQRMNLPPEMGREIGKFLGGGRRSNRRSSGGRSKKASRNRRSKRRGL